MRRILADAPATEDDLECGTEPTPIEHNCSGKHAGFLALCRARAGERRLYRSRPPVSAGDARRDRGCCGARSRRRCRSRSTGAASRPSRLTLERARAAFGRLAALEGGDRVVAAMRAHPSCSVGPSRPTSADPRARRLGREGRRGGALLCRVARRARGRGQGRGRSLPRDHARALAPPLARSASRHRARRRRAAEQPGRLGEACA